MGVAPLRLGGDCACAWSRGSWCLRWGAHGGAPPEDAIGPAVWLRLPRTEEVRGAGEKERDWRETGLASEILPIPPVPTPTTHTPRSASSVLLPPNGDCLFRCPAADRYCRGARPRDKAPPSFLPCTRHPWPAPPPEPLPVADRPCATVPAGTGWAGGGSPRPTNERRPLGDRAPKPPGTGCATPCRTYNARSAAGGSLELVCVFWAA